MTDHSKPSLRPHPASSQRGAVLIIVLSCLVLLAALAVGLLKRVEVDRANAVGFRGGVQSRGLAEYAVNTVIAQISTATTRGANVGWASQPGMIRTFSSAGTNAYKLYSAPALVQSNVAPGDFATMDMPAAAWASTPALWTDLNAPVVSGGRTNYPIVDASATNRVEGFSITGAPGATAAQRAPMPVQWLYVLEDGTLAPASGSGSTVTVSGATANNPIVGRIAFWTDDESAKININTASEGTFWDTPRVDSTQERNLASFQPAQGEFQRYPGHPATVSLAPVFFATASNATPVLTPAQRNAIFDIVPRINGGGSQAGTVRATDPITPDADRLYANIDELIFNVARDSQPGSAAIDREKIERARFFLTANSRAPEITLFNTPRVATWPVFFDHTNAANANRVTAYDRLLAFCATTAPDSIYYFQRQDSKSPVNDWNNIPRNQELLRYLQALSGKNIPGFGASMEGKLGAADRDQLLVQMFDYIRSSNLYDDNLSPVTYGNQLTADNAVQFTGGRRTADLARVWPGHGFVAPIRVPQGLTGTAPAPGTETAANRPHLGFGRFHTITEAGLLFICNADGSNEMSNDPETNRMLAEDTPLLPTERRVQMMLFFDLYSPMQGWTQYGMDGSMDVEVDGDFMVNGMPVPFHPSSGLSTPGTPETVNFDNNGISHYHPHGGHIGFRKSVDVNNRRRAPGENGWNSRTRYGLISEPFTVDVSAGDTMNFSAPLITVRFYSRTKDVTGRATERSANDLVQTIELDFPNAVFPVPRLVTTGTPDTGGAQTTTMDYWWALALRGALVEGGSADGRLFGIYNHPRTTLGNFIRLEDTLKTLVPYHADPRLVAGSSFVPAGVFQPSTFYFSTAPDDSVKSYLTGGSRSDDANQGGANSAMYRPPADDRLVPGANYTNNYFPKFTGFALASGNLISGRPFQQLGDFDQGIARVFDGAYINKPDEGHVGRASTDTPYFFNSYDQVASGPTFFSPNRQIPGPGMFGSLPTKLWSGNTPLDPAAPTANTNSWRTLLFRPQTGHPGTNNPPDHLWMDLFWMPVVEPYAISEPFSTAGKINMNYAIAPFRYIRRATGMVALLRNEQLTVIPTARANNYKTGAGNTQFRYPIDIHGTLAALDAKFNGGDIYKSATEICDIPLRASGVTVNYATTHSLTGDNTRERPYVNLQTRLTTKSNVYTVHYRVEVLKKRGGSTPNQWTEGEDQVVSTLRGSSLIERFLDPNTAVPDYAEAYAANANATPGDLGNFYRWRVLSERQFSP